MSAWNAIPSGQPLGETRRDLLAIHFALNEPCSCGCGQPLKNPELHHAILTRRKCQGVSKEHEDIWNHPINLALVNKSCHERAPGPRFFWKLACKRYGEMEVRAWYNEARRVFRSQLEDYS